MKSSIRKKVLICGASGFIGRNIALSMLEKDDYELYGTFLKSETKIPGVKMIKADLTDKAQVDRAVKGMDIIIQAAATTSGAKEIVTKPYYHVTDNAVMNSLILRAAFLNKISTFVFFSCTVMYQSGVTPVKETDFDAGRALHQKYFGVGWTKVYIEKMCEFYSNICPTRFIVIRHSNIYGPHDKFDLEKSHVFGATMTKVMRALDDFITVWGKGSEERDLLYISDLTDFVRIAIEKEDTGFSLYNAGSGACISITSLVEKIIKHSGKKLKIKHDTTKPSIDTKLCLDIKKAKDILGWSPKVSLDEGIAKTMGWYRRHNDYKQNTF